MIHVPGYPRVRKFSDQMAGDGSPEQPAGVFRGALGICIKFRAGDIGVLVEILLDTLEDRFEVAAQPCFRGSGPRA
jgi:hypothetical protein